MSVRQPDQKPVENKAAKANASDNSSHKELIRGIIKGLGMSDTDDVPKAWLNMAGQFHKHAHRDALSAPRGIDEQVLTLWSDMKIVLDAVLDKFEARYLAVHGLIDNLLKRPDKAAAAKTLRNNVPNNRISLQYFFDQLADPEWLDILSAEGFFSNPPKLEYHRDNGTVTVTFQDWAASRYLARVASSAPESVLNLMHGIVTDNSRVYEDLVDAAISMPTEHAVELVPVVKTWLEAPYHLQLPEKVGALVVVIAEGGFAAAAIDLGRTLLSVAPSSSYESAQEETSLWGGSNPSAMHAWQFANVLNHTVPALIRAGGNSALVMLCDILNDALSVDATSVSMLDADDGSDSWRPSIESDPPPASRDLENALVSAIRDAGDQIFVSNPNLAVEIVTMLESYRRRIFLRLALHVLRRFPAKALIPERLLNEDRFFESPMMHEYVLLAQEHFPSISATGPAPVESWLLRGPDLDGFISTWRDFYGQLPTDEIVKTYQDEWVSDRLCAFHGGLPAEWQARYTELEGTRQNALRGRPTMLGSVSPKTEAELRIMAVADIAGYVRSWQPNGRSESPTAGGLAQTLARVIASDPSRFAQDATLFQGVQPVYVNALVDGLTTALAGDQQWTWAPLLQLSKWINEQDTSQNSGPKELTKVDWTSVKRNVVNLVCAGIEKRVVPFNLQPNVWAVIQRVSDDPDPTPAYETEFLSTHNTDPISFARLTVRGEAMNTLVSYAVWVRELLERPQPLGVGVTPSLNEMPEVREVLDSHLDITKDASLAVRSIYGRRFADIIWLDPEWAIRNRNRVFPDTDAEQIYGDVAWDTYVVFNEPSFQAFDVLTSQYKRAISDINSQPEQPLRHWNPRQRLTEHVMLLYTWGRLEIDGPNGMLQDFYTTATGELRHFALEFLGRQLHNTQGNVRAEPLAQLKRLWEWRLHDAKTSATPASDIQELAAFGWWFTSGKFEGSWAVSQLLQVVNPSGKIDTPHRVIEQLAQLCSQHPRATVEALHFVVQFDLNGQALRVSRDHVRTVLSNALHSDDHVARDLAMDLTNRLYARGYGNDFRGLLTT